MINVEETIISQYGNSATITQLIQNMNTYIDPRADFDKFYDYVWNVDTAEGFGLDIWGRIVDIERTINVPSGTPDPGGNPNILLYSEYFNNAAWFKGKSTIRENETTAPDGSLSADKLQETNETGSHYIFQYFTGGLIERNYSVYAKAGERSRFDIIGGGSATVSGASFNLATGTVSAPQTAGVGNASANSTITAVGDGWYRCSVRRTVTGTNTNIQFRISNGTTTNYAGTTGSGLYLWGAQITAGAEIAEYMPSTVNFVSRASIGTYTGSNGLIQTASNNVARLEYNRADLLVASKLLLEGAATNLLTYSEQFGNASWTKSQASVTDNVVVAPDGVTSADKLYENTANSQHIAYKSSSAIVAGSNVTVSCYFKSAGRTTGWLQVNNPAFTSGFRASFNLTSATAFSVTFGLGSLATTSIENVGNGWYRVTSSGIIDGVTTLPTITIALNDGLSYVGDGVSGLYLWGAQLEVGGNATSYIPTVASTATRADDISTSTQSATYVPGVVTLTDDEYRTVLLVKALANITNGTAQGINQLLQNLFASRGRCYVRDTGSMTMVFTFEFFLKPFEYVILMAAGVAPRPAGVLSNIFQVDVPNTFGFAESIHLQPFDQGTFYVSL